MEVRSLLSLPGSSTLTSSPTSENEVKDTDDDEEDLEDKRLIVDAFFNNPNLERFRVEEVPKSESWALNPLYAVDATGHMRFWEIGFNAPTSQLYYRHGVVGTSKPGVGIIDVTINKSGRNLKEQALLEARSKYNTQYTVKSYRPAGAETPPTIKVATAEKYTRGMIKRWPVACQPKLDGHRMTATEENGKLSYRARSNRPMNQMHYMDDELSKFMIYLPRSCLLDGELYNHSYPQSQLEGIIKTYKGGYHSLLTTIEYYIFDIYWQENPPYEDRYNLLLDAYERYIEDGNTNTKFFIVACALANSDDDIDDLHRSYVLQGYEGLMVRKLAGPNRTATTIRESEYHQGRSRNMLKYKQFFDDEGTITDVYEGTGTEKGLAIFEVEDKKGNRFGVRPRGSFGTRRRWFREPKSKFIGRLYTYRYFELTEYDIPRFPVGIGFRDYLE